MRTSQLWPPAAFTGVVSRMSATACTAASPKGRYVYSEPAAELSGGKKAHWSTAEFIGQEYFDGKGGWYIVEQSPTAGTPYKASNGSVVVGPDCAVWEQHANGEPYFLVLLANGQMPYISRSTSVFEIGLQVPGVA